MRRVWAERTIDAPSSVVWRLLTDVEHWPTWGPSVRFASIDGGRMHEGATGSVTTVGGVTLPFEITSFVDGASWAWAVAGIGATDHRIETLDDGRSAVGFGVPWLVTPYAVTCHVALRRLEALAVSHADGAAGPRRSARTP